MTAVFLLAAGLGTRLRPLTESRPKPLTPVCGVPLLAYSLALCAKHGLRSAVINTHYLPERFAAWHGVHEGVTLSFSHEPVLLGTGGGLAKVKHTLDPRFVVLNGDVLHGVDLTALRAAVPAGGAAMALREDPVDAPRYGLVLADQSDTVVQLTSVARAEPQGEVEPNTHFTGIHALSREALDLVPDGFACIVRTSYAALVPARKVRAISYQGPWLDIGDPEAYLAANLAVLQDPSWLALDPFLRAGFARRADGTQRGDASLVAGCTLDGPVWVGPGAVIPRGSHLSRCVVGAHATLAQPTRLTESVVWDGVTLDQPALHRGVAHERGVLAL